MTCFLPPFLLTGSVFLLPLKTRFPTPAQYAATSQPYKFGLQIRTHIARQLVDTASPNAPTASEQSQDTFPSAYSVRSCHVHSAVLDSCVGLDYWYTTVYINYPGLLDMPRCSVFFKDANINEHMPLSCSDDPLR